MKGQLCALVACLLCVLSGKLVAAEEPEAAKAAGTAATAEGDQLPSVILDLRRARSDFDTHFAEKLEPQIERMGEVFQATATRAEELLAKRQKDPTNARLQAEYEDCISEGLRQGMTWLGNFSQLKEPTFQALDGVGKSIGVAQQAMANDLAQSHTEFKANQGRAEAIQQRLKALAQQYKEQIREGKPLPPEVEQDICGAQADREAAEAMTKIDELQEAKIREVVADLETQQAEWVRVKGELQTAFRQADNQRLLLGKMANLKRIGLQTQVVRQQLDVVQDLVKKQETRVRNLNAVVRQIMDKDFAAGNLGSKRPITAKPTQAGIEILRGYLDETVAKKDKSDVVKK
jgi:hypothetical protein